MKTNEKHLQEMEEVMDLMEELGLSDEMLEELAEESYMQSMMERGICPF